MTAKELSDYVGKTGLWEVAGGPVAVKVKIVDSRQAYGRVDLRITPCQGRGEAWVDRESVKDIK